MTPQIKQRIDQLRRGEVPEGYKKTKVGTIPSEWNLCMINDCLEKVDNPVKVEPDTLYTQIGIRSHGKGLFYKEPITGKELGNKSVFWVEPDCFVLNIVFAWEQAFGKTTADEVGMIGSHRFPMYRPINNSVDLDYLIYYFMTKRGTDVLDAASPGGAGRNRTLGQDRFMRSKILLPPLAEQKKIAEILSAQDKLIALKEKLIEEKKRQKKYLMQQLLTQSCNNILPLSEIASITMGQSPDSASYNEDFIGLPLIQGNADITNRIPTPRMYTSAPTKKCNNNDVLLSVRAPVGTVSRSNIHACIGRGMCAINADELTDYIYQYLLYYEDRWGRVSQGSTFESISGDDIAKMMIPVYDDYKNIQNILVAADSEIDLLNRNLDQEKQKKKALMQLLLSGFVRVNV